MNNIFDTPVELLGEYRKNSLYIKRDDLIPYSFGGNKVRKSWLFYREIDSGNFDCVVTYGSSHSNHCRIIANMAAERNLKCYIVSPKEDCDFTFNSRFMKLFDADIISAELSLVSETIERTMRKLRNTGHNPYFIPGGGHGNLGTQAYVDCYLEIKEFEKKNSVYFDYIFLASGTGTTQAGLICGQLMNNDSRSIIGISIARKNPRGRDIVIKSVDDFLYKKEFIVSHKKIEEKTVFLDSFIGDGYGKNNTQVYDVIKRVMIKYGIPLDSTYTGKAFLGMDKYIMNNFVENRNILFIHTGGTPLFFNDIERL